MSSGARHGLGVVIGLVVTPVIAVCLMYSTTKFSEYFRYFYTRGGGDRWLGAAVVLVAAVLVGVVVGSRISPLASLIPGFVYTAVGVLWVASPRWAIGHSGRDLFPRELYLGYTFIAPYGIFLLLGVALLAASVAPSRWKARTGAAPRFAGPPPAPMGPPPLPGSPAPLGGPQPPPAPGQSPPWQGAPQYGQPPAQPASAAPPAPSPSPPSAPPAPASGDKPKPSSSGSGPDDEEPGDWTRMYGGNRPT
ncbi:hypothetical protein [Actinomadura madurae]|uniref:hypothetical protein n=1 Tax=Actinomadura madurae TaxID=1993 RepID=UPI002026A318|nr:hypothetical protein [Actinomadura madurae]MCP9950595.1 hypothetical protein [Actinomadura madurae]MCP9979831.1 hypothetical protein [Actinomadura madurae]MCQ0008638.1 hypothetical protein [Actinomadura madurae]URM96133.1 hypothetical protein LUW76_18380 [Actinomadura madurae]URN06836.1 hypothetical protein LUW74_28305 [Actinomadura madurae]